ncbi:AAA family ATPase, partial [Parafrankia colletiae]|uniref:AAA family ATPase n=2 Tax=Parafrankia colletiae TaxID=573497 RepID=UPI0018E3F5AF
MKHDLSRLNEHDFEHLAQALMMAVFGRGTVVYGDGPDGGRDATFDGVVLLPEEAGGGTWAGYGVMQAKFRRRPHGDARDARWLAQQLEKEFEWWSNPKSGRASKGRAPAYLLVVTNVVLSPALGGGGIDIIEQLISKHAAGLGLKNWWVWHHDTLGRLLEIHPGVRRSYAGEILSGDVMSSLLEWMATEPDTDARVRRGGGGPSAACPYKGLAAFTESDEGLFFGREQLTVRLAARLAHSYGEGRPLVVLGASGAGKSSVLAAGLLPALRRGQLGIPGSADWPHVTLTPTATPLRALATALAPALDAAQLSADAVAAELRDAPSQVAARLRGRHLTSLSPTSAGRGVVLVVDQFEELFTLCNDLGSRRAFLDALAVLAGCTDDTPTPAAAVVLGIRADFIEHLAAYPRLREAVEAYPVLVGPMSGDEVRCAIEQPAAAAGLNLEPGLADVILEDLDANPVSTLSRSAQGRPGHHVGHLPLLSHALLVTCQRSGGTLLTLAAYHATGGIRRAVASTAEEILGRFDDAHRETARHLLLDLVRVGEGTDDTRRKVPLERLLTSTADPRRARDVLNALAAPDARLVTIHEQHVEITHEALLRAWPTLRSWIDSDRAGQLLRQRLDDDANTWHDDNRAPGHLYQGHRLATATAWAADPRNRAQMSPRARDFLAASREHTRRTQRRAIAVVAVLATLVTAGGITALVQWQRALDREQATERARRTAIAESLLARADALQNDDPRTALRLGVAANAIADGPRPRMNLLDTLVNSNLAATLPGHTATATVNAIAFAETTGTLATGSADGTAFLWNISDPDRPRLLTGPLRGNTGGVLAAAFTPDGSFLALSGTGTSDFGRGGGDRVTDDADVILWDTSNPASPRRIGQPLTGHVGNITGAVFTAGGRTLITGSTNNSQDDRGTII